MKYIKKAWAELLAALCAAATAILLAAWGVQDSWAFFWWAIGLAAVATGLQIFIAIRDRHRTEDIREAKAETQTFRGHLTEAHGELEAVRQELDTVRARTYLILERGVLPVGGLAARLWRETPGKRESTLEVLARQVVNSVCTALHDQHPDGRAIAYQLVETNGHLELAVIAFYGRHVTPVPFAGNDDRGQSALRTLRRGKTRIEPDLTNHPPEDWHGSGAGYDTFISVPIVGVLPDPEDEHDLEDEDDGATKEPRTEDLRGSKGYGMLTFDTPVANSIGAEDKLVIESFASLLAAGFASVAHRPTR